MAHFQPCRPVRYRFAITKDENSHDMFGAITDSISLS